MLKAYSSRNISEYLSEGLQEKHDSYAERKKTTFFSPFPVIILKTVWEIALFIRHKVADLSNELLSLSDKSSRQRVTTIEILTPTLPDEGEDWSDRLAQR